MIFFIKDKMVIDLWWFNYFYIYNKLLIIRIFKHRYYIIRKDNKNKKILSNKIKKGLQMEKKINLGSVKKLVDEINHTKFFNLDVFEKALLVGQIIDMWSHYTMFYNSDDLCHGENHIFEVLQRSFKIGNYIVETGDVKISKFGQLKNFYMCLALASFVHDIFQEDHRSDHHIRAKVYCEMLIERNNSENEPKYLIDFTNEMLELVSLMVLEHRASFEGNFSNIECEIFSAADRDELNLDSIIRRSFAFNENKDRDFFDIKSLPNKIFEINGNQYSTKKLMDDLIANNWDYKSIRVFYHMIDKFGRNGYMFEKKEFSFNVYNSYYKDQLEGFWEEIEVFVLLPNTFYEKYKSLVK